jgi:hypothetical protein
MPKSQVKTKEELDNDSVIPAELKSALAKKTELVINHISVIENALNEAIDDVVEDSETPITITEINAAIFNVLKKLNQREIMGLIK